MNYIYNEVRWVGRLKEYDLGKKCESTGKMKIYTKCTLKRCTLVKIGTGLGHCSDRGQVQIGCWRIRRDVE